MKVIRDKYLQLHPTKPGEREILSSILSTKCVHDNPKYKKMMDSGRWQKGIKKKLQTYKEFNGSFHVYKGNYDIYSELFLRGIIIDEFYDNRVVGEPINIKCKYEPRDDQQKECIESLKMRFDDWGYGMIDATPGFGK